MKFNDRTANIQSHSHSLLFGRKERREQLFTDRRRNPRATVRHTNPDLIIDNAETDCHSASFGRRIDAHRIDSVAHEIEQHLLQHHAVSIQRHGNIGNLSNDAYVMQFGVCLDEANAVLNDFDYVAWCQLRLALAHEVVHPTDDMAGATRLNPQLFHGRLQFFLRKIVSRQLVPRPVA